MEEQLFDNYFDIRFESEKLYNIKRIEDEIEKRNLKKTECIIKKDFLKYNLDGSCTQRIYYK